MLAVAPMVAAFGMTRGTLQAVELPLGKGNGHASGLADALHWPPEPGAQVRVLSGALKILRNQPASRGVSPVRRR